jgi:hypothetical protein
MDGLNVVQSDLKGAHLALVVGATNRFVFSLMARPEIKRVSELSGKKIGITGIGSSTHRASLYAPGSPDYKPGVIRSLSLVEIPNI